MTVFQALQEGCESRMDKNAADVVTDEFGIYRLPLRLMIPCLDRLLKSANNWHKRDGMRGYLGLISRFV